jgi:hypothetical protein
MKKFLAAIFVLAAVMAMAGAAAAFSKTVTLVNDTGKTLLELCIARGDSDIIIFDGNLKDGKSFKWTFNEESPSLYGRIAGRTIEWNWVPVGEASKIYLQEDGSVSY